MAQYYAIRTRATRPAMMTEGLNEQELASYARHSVYFKQLVADGIEVFAGRARRADGAGWALGIIKAESEEAARRIMTEDPFVQDGVVDAELFEFEILAIQPQDA